MLVELLVGMMSIGTPSKKMSSECWSFFFLLFLVLYAKGEKIRGVNNFFVAMARRLL